MCKINFINNLTRLEDSVRNTENFLSLLRDESKIKRLDLLYNIVKEIRNDGVDLQVLPSYNMYSKIKREKDLEIIYIKINNSDFDKLSKKYGIVKEKNKIMITL